ncbi:MAG: signal peptidase II [Candidatus Absconditabacteria bacterium]|nr:signal peptidase II [Candidatus Absconditabacteria bacterium]
MKSIFKKTILLIILIGLFLFIDLLTKYFFYDLKIAESLLFINPVLNTGVSRSIPVHAIISIAIAIFALVLFIWLYFKKYISLIIATLLIAGTLGNMIDRIRLGGVRDFLMPFDWFPVFNIADIFLNLGVVAYLRKEFFTGKNKLKS